MRFSEDTAIPVDGDVGCLCTAVAVRVRNSDFDKRHVNVRSVNHCDTSLSVLSKVNSRTALLPRCLEASERCRDGAVAVRIAIVVFNNGEHGAACRFKFPAANGIGDVFKGIEPAEQRIAALGSGIAKLSSSDDLYLALRCLRPEGRNHGKGQDRDR